MAQEIRVHHVSRSALEPPRHQGLSRDELITRNGQRFMEILRRHSRDAQTIREENDELAQLNEELRGLKEAA